MEALQDLPEDLPRTFERILKNLCGHNDIKFARRIFSWLAVAKRPLRLEELREAIAIEPMATDINTVHLVNDITQTLACCGCLVVVDEEQETVHFTHHSVKQYLLQESSDPLLSEYHVDFAIADDYAGQICITYLSFECFDRSVAKASSSGAKLVDIPAAIVRQRLPYSRLTNKIAALTLLRNRSTLDRSVHRQLGESTDRVQQYSFLVYAKEWWISHTKRLEPTFKRSWELWCRLLTDQNSKADKPWHPHDRSSQGPNKPISEWALTNSHTGLLIYLGTETTLGCISRQSYLIELARQRHWRAIYVILVMSEHETWLEDAVKVTSLMLPAARFDRLDIFHYGAELLRDVHMTGFQAVLQSFDMLPELHPNNGCLFKTWSPLVLAAVGGHIRIIGYILTRQYLTDEDSVIANIGKALVAAAAFEKLAVVHYLLTSEKVVAIPGIILCKFKGIDNGPKVLNHRLYDYCLDAQTYLYKSLHYAEYELLREFMIKYPRATIKHSSPNSRTDPAGLRHKSIYIARDS